MRTSLNSTQFRGWVSLSVLLVVAGILAGSCRKEERPAEPAKRPREIRVLYFAGLAEGQMIRESLPKFTESTGIQVKYEELPYDSIRQREITSIESKLGSYDVIFVDDIWMVEYARKGYVIPLDDYVKRDRIDMSDFPQPVRAAEAELDGKIWLMPQRADVQVLFYRRDLFENQDYRQRFQNKYRRALTVPETWQEYREVAEFFSREGAAAPKRFFATGETLKRPHFAFEFFAMRYWSMTGQQFLNGTEPLFASPGGVEALTYLTSLRPYAAPGSANAAHDETIGAFASGQLAMAPQWYAFYATLRNPEGSSVVDQLGVAPVPGFRLPDGTIRRAPSIGGGGLGIAADARDRESAWAFIRYVTSPEFMADGALRGMIMPRVSGFKNPEVRRRNPAVDVYLSSLNAAWFRPRLVKYAEIESIIGRAVSRAYVGEAEPGAALRDADKEVRAALARP